MLLFRMCEEIEPIIIDDYPIREIILGRSTLRRYNYDLHESRKYMVITCNEKNFFIPIVPDKNRQSKLVIKKSLVLKALSANKDEKKILGALFFYALIFCKKSAIRFGTSSLRLSAGSQVASLSGYRSHLTRYCN